MKLAVFKNASLPKHVPMVSLPIKLLHGNVGNYIRNNTHYTGKNVWVLKSGDSIQIYIPNTMGYYRVEVIELND